MNIFVKGRPAACLYTLDKYIYGLIPSACKEVLDMAKRFTELDRHKLEFALKAKMPVAEISKQLGFSKVAVYAEIKKGTVKQIGTDLKEYYVYLADAGQRVHDERKKHCGAKKKYLPDAPLIQEITSLILDCRYSPEAAILKLRTAAVCTKTIYNYVHAGYLPGVDENKLLPERGKAVEAVFYVVSDHYSSGQGGYLPQPFATSAHLKSMLPDPEVRLPAG